MKCIAISGEYVYDKTNDNGIGQVATLKCNKGFAYPGNKKYPSLSYQQQVIYFYSFFIIWARSLNQWWLILQPVLPIKHESLKENGKGELETLEANWQR